MKLKKILCPFHFEKTPSCALYPDGQYHCFSCGAHGPIDKLDLNVERLPSFSETKFVEDIKATMKYIQGLELTEVRGLKLPHDKDYYYIVWPDGKYYKKRMWNPVGNDKYRCPIGHKKPLLWCTKSHNKILVIVEGEINALTLKDCDVMGVDIVSPGSATDLNKKAYCKDYLPYDKICIIVDRDAAGVCAGIELKAKLQNAGKTVTLYPMERDLNEIYIHHGRKEVHRLLTEALRLFSVIGHR